MWLSPLNCNNGCSTQFSKLIIFPFKMSWAEYLSNLQRDGLKHAAICGLEGANWFLVTDGSNVSTIQSSKAWFSSGYLCWV